MKKPDILSTCSSVWKNKMWTRIVNLIIEHAKKTPYWHLDGYMERYWLIPTKDAGSAGSTGCYTAKWYRNPFVWFCQLLGVSVRVHHILSSDPGRDFHDHPWPFVTIILKGGYFESRPRYDRSGLYLGAETKWHGAGSVLYRPAKAWHRLALWRDHYAIPKDVVIPTRLDSAWTLFIMGPYQQKWGFLSKPDAKTYYRDYLQEEQ